ncbi:MAG: DUF971 domain-containing protein [Phycisphaeraceae bacterium]|nr:DUF971 domain-containing protein [Phycisphaeraceae bacterium]
MAPQPKHLHLDKEKGLSVVWHDGTESFYPIKLLRRMSPSADARTLRESMERNPLTVLPASASSGEPLRAVDAELVGNYAIRIRFSDGHDTGLFSWVYLREIDPAVADPGVTSPGSAGPGAGASGGGRPETNQPPASMDTDRPPS